MTFRELFVEEYFLRVLPHATFFSLIILRGGVSLSFFGYRRLRRLTGGEIIHTPGFD